MFGQVISTFVFRTLFSSYIGYQQGHNYTEIVLSILFLNDNYILHNRPTW